MLLTPPLDCDGGKSTKRAMEDFKKKHAAKTESQRGGRGRGRGRGGRGRGNRGRGRGGYNKNEGKYFIPFTLLTLNL